MKKKQQTGQALVEFALTIVPLLAIMLLMTTAGVALYRYHAVSSAAARGAEEAALFGGNVGGGTTAACSSPSGEAAIAACDELRRWVGNVADNASVTVMAADGTPTVTVGYNEVIRVRVELPVTLQMIPGAGSLIEETITLQAERARRVQRQAP